MQATGRVREASWVGPHTPAGDQAAPSSRLPPIQRSVVRIWLSNMPIAVDSGTISASASAVSAVIASLSFVFALVSLRRSRSTELREAESRESHEGAVRALQRERQDTIADFAKTFQDFAGAMTQWARTAMGSEKEAIKLPEWWRDVGAVGAGGGHADLHFKVGSKSSGGVDQLLITNDGTGTASILGLELLGHPGLLRDNSFEYFTQLPPGKVLTVPLPPSLPPGRGLEVLMGFGDGTGFRSVEQEVSGLGGDTTGFRGREAL